MYNIYDVVKVGRIKFFALRKMNLTSKMRGNKMTGFEKIHFKGTLRDYQQRVIDNSDKYLKDGKINIVAAPGS